MCARSAIAGLPEASLEALLRGCGLDGRRSCGSPPHRPRNAYNRVQAFVPDLASTGEPMIVVPADLRLALLDIKHGRTPIERTPELAQALAAEGGRAGA